MLSSGTRRADTHDEFRRHVSLYVLERLMMPPGEAAAAEEEEEEEETKMSVPHVYAVISNQSWCSGK